MEVLQGEFRPQHGVSEENQSPVDGRKGPFLQFSEGGGKFHSKSPQPGSLIPKPEAGKGARSRMCSPSTPFGEKLTSQVEDADVGLSVI